MKRLLVVGFLVASLGWGQTPWLNPTDGRDGVLTGAGVFPGALDADNDNVYHFASINIPTAFIINSASLKAAGPLVFLVQGDVNITGSIILAGGAGGLLDGPQPIPGPGGFTAGHGPGAPGVGTTPGFLSTYPPNSTCAAVHALPLAGCGLPYGSATLLPLLGGSGGGNSMAYWGGAGGGAIRIVAGGTITIAGGGIVVVGGAGGAASGAGSGGAIHLVAPTINVSRLNIGNGRARIDATTTSPAVLTTTQILGGGLYARFPLPDAPIPLPKPGSLQVRVGGTLVPAAADADLSVPDVQYTGGTPTLEVTAKNIPPGTPVHAVCKPTGGGTDVQVVLPVLAGTFDLSTSSASLPLTTATARCAVQAHW